MTRRKFGSEFKIEAVKLVTERGVSVAQAARDLDLAESVLRRWMRELATAPATAFPGNGQQRADLAEIAALKKEVAKLKIDELALAKGDGRIAARMKSLAKVDLLILDDWGLEPLEGNARHHLLEIIEDRYGRRSTLVTSQLPIARWHELIGNPTYADAILDRLVHNAHRLEITGDPLRRITQAGA